jgi:hypothetical protein
MFDHAGKFQAPWKPACIPAIALLTIGLSVNFTWAGSDQLSGVEIHSH